MTVKTGNKPKKKSAPKVTEAQRADRHELYQKSVQAPEHSVEFFTEQYRKVFAADPKLLREDFCGTAFLSTEWCKNHENKRALGVDLCRDTLDWGMQHNIQPAGEQIAARIQLRHADVLEIGEPRADVTCAMNFSYQVFKTRAQMLRYFRGAYQGLADQGLFILDIFGGTEAMEAMEEEREVEDETFTYIWDQDKFNPITHDILCYIHFLFEDGSRMDKAFTYDWRLWSIPELSELLTEAGFNTVRVFWEEMAEDEDDDEYLEGTGEYYETREVENQESWVTYLVAEKRPGV